MVFVLSAGPVLANDKGSGYEGSDAIAGEDPIVACTPTIWTGNLDHYKIGSLAVTMPEAYSLAPSLQEEMGPMPDEGITTLEDDYEITDASGNDPRDFTSKFMPYYRYMDLENRIEIQTLTVFGMFAFNPRFAMTYEMPIMQHQDYSDWKIWKQANALGLNPDEDTIGVGDLGLRFFLRPAAWEWRYSDPAKGGSFMPLVETTVPTANEDALGGDTWVISPGFCLVLDMPFESPPLGLGFLALMNFYDFDALKDDDVTDFGAPIDNDDLDNEVSRYRGRWFWMQPFSKPAFVDNPDDKSFHVFDLTGLYLLTEFQPMYDFEEDEASFWIGPEIGKILREGCIIYAKPGWGIDNDKGRMSGDRKFTFEFGFRYFL
jgi:hypothetical protein